MPSTDALLGFTALSVLLVLIPGPSVLFIVGRGVAFGRRSALATVLGNTTGAFVQVMVIAIGLGPLIDRSPTLLELIRWFGALYLIILGIRSIRRRHAESHHGRAADRAHVREGFIVGLSNPKLAVFLIAVLPQFVDDARGAALQIAVLGTVFATVALVCDGAWAMLAGSARRWFATSPSRRSRLTAAGGIMMVMVGLVVAIH